jgi:aspartate aminotransferase
MSDFNDFLSPRMHRFKPSPSQMATARVRELTNQGRDIVKLTAGEPDFPTPDVAKAAVMELMETGHIGYTPINGTLEMRKAVQEKFRRDNGIEFGLDEITVGSGTKQILFNALMATVDEGDEAIIGAPYWTSYIDMVQLAGGTPVIVRCEQNRGFKMTPEMLADAITPRTKWFVFSSPNNPTGTTYNREEIAGLAAVLMENPHVHVLCDDVYEHLVYDGRTFATMIEVEPRLRDRTLTCNGVSKAYSMTGWRVGFAGGPAPLIAALSKMQSQSTAGASAVGQAAAAAALLGPIDYVRERTLNLQARRDLLYDALNKIAGLRCDRPEGAMYIFCSCAQLLGKRTPGGVTIDNDGDFVEYLINDANVAVVQGGAYGMPSYFRASFVASEADLHRGAQRIAEAVAALVDA